ncbi:MAG: response regulator transcription factor [Patescibacteria group bacterium]
MRLLLIEDENAIAIPLKRTLERRGYAVDYEENGEMGLRQALVNEYDCILLDINLPGMDGLSVAHRLREKGKSTPILMLTARNLQKNIWEGFESGADDYLTKPFDLKELVYRISSLTKRTKRNSEEIFLLGEYKIDTNAIKVTKEEKVLPLNRKEFGILEYLLRQRGKVVTAEELLEHVWDANIDSFSQTVRTNIKTLRKKIDPMKNYIKTVKGYGYIIE